MSDNLPATRSESLSPAARTAGVAVNQLTPTASVGGDFVKAGLVRRWVPVTDGFASVMVDKLTFALGETIFVVVGLASTSTCMESSLLLVASQSATLLRLHLDGGSSGR
jgi:hypothetical protein